MFHNLSFFSWSKLPIRCFPSKASNINLLSFRYSNIPVKSLVGICFSKRTLSCLVTTAPLNPIMCVTSISLLSAIYLISSTERPVATEKSPYFFASWYAFKSSCSTNTEFLTYVPSKSVTNKFFMKLFLHTKHFLDFHF